MYDPVYGGDPEAEKEFKICLICGATNCEEHDKPVDPMEVMAPNAVPITAGDFLRMFGEAKGLSISQKDIDEANVGEQKLIHTGEESEGTEVEEDEEQQDQETEEGEEEKIQFPKNLQVYGGSYVYKKYQDIDTKAVKFEASHVLFLKNDMVMGTLSGNIRSSDFFRAKKDEGRIPGRMEAIKAEAQKHVPAMKRRLHLALEAQARVARQRGLKRGSLDAGRLSNVVADGSSNVFSKKANRVDTKTAVSIVLDDSGSMEEIVGQAAVTDCIGKMTHEQFFLTKAGCCAVFAYALGEVLQSLNVAFEIVSYEDHLGDPFGESSYGMKYGHGRFSIEYKGFEEPWAQAKERLVNYLPCSGGSITYESAVFAAKRLIARREERKILFHLTDAQDGNHGMDKLYGLTQELQKKANVQYVGVGILEKTMKKYLKDRCEIIERLATLNDVVIERLAKLVHPV